MSKIKIFSIIFVLFVLVITSVGIFIRNIENRIRNEDSSPSMIITVDAVNKNQDHVSIRMSKYVKIGLLEINYRVGGDQEIAIIRDGQLSDIPLKDIGWSVTPYNESYIPSIAFEKALLQKDKTNNKIMGATISTSSFKEVYSWVPIKEETMLTIGGLPPTISGIIKEGLTKITLFGKVVWVRLTNQKALKSDWVVPSVLLQMKILLLFNPFYMFLQRMRFAYTMKLNLMFIIRHKINNI